MKFPCGHLLPEQNQRGNALFLILIAVVLFGALSFAVSSMMRDGNVTAITTESLKIARSEITDYARIVRLGVQNTRISNGCEDTDINFDTGLLTAYTNAGAPSSNVCDIFHISGGGVGYTVPNADWLDESQSASALYGEWYITGNEAVSGIGNTGTSDLVLFLPWIKQSICDHLNTALGISGDTIDGFTFVTNQKFTGSYSSGNTIGAAAAGLVGKSTGCLTDSDGAYFFFQVLLSR